VGSTCVSPLGPGRKFYVTQDLDVDLGKNIRLRAGLKPRFMMVPGDADLKVRSTTPASSRGRSLTTE